MQNRESGGTERVVGIWTNDDGFIRHTLFENGRYEESRGSRSDAFSGNYAVQGSRMDYLNEAGFGYGELINGALHHGGMVLRRACSLFPITPRKEACADRFHASLSSQNVDA